MAEQAANPFPDSEICECCDQRYPIEQMHMTDDPCWLCQACWDQALESQGPMLVEDDDSIAEHCVDCGDEFHDDDTGGYNPPCSCGMHCRSCHDTSAHRIDDDDDDPYYPEDDEPHPDTAEEVDQATDRFWDGRVGHSVNTTNDDSLPF